MENSGTFETFEYNKKQLEEIQEQFRTEINLLEKEIALLNKNKSKENIGIKEIKEKSNKKIEENNLFIKKNEELIKETNRIIEENNKKIEENKKLMKINDSILSDDKKKEKEKIEKINKIEEEILEKNDMIKEHKKLIEENVAHLEELKNPKKPEEKIEKDIIKDTEKALSIKKEGAVFFREAEFKQAMDKFEESLLYIPEDDISLITILNSNIGICFMRLKQYKEAITSFNIAIGHNPNFVKAQVNRAECNYQLKNYEACITDYDDLMKKNKKFVNLSKYNEIKRLHQMEFNEKKEEVMGQMKDLGNKFLGMFGMSTDNFNLNQNPNGGYNIGFQQN